MKWQNWFLIEFLSAILPEKCVFTMKVGPEGYQHTFFSVRTQPQQDLIWYFAVFRSRLSTLKLRLWEGEVYCLYQSCEKTVRLQINITSIRQHSCLCPMLGFWEYQNPYSVCFFFHIPQLEILLETISASICQNILRSAELKLYFWKSWFCM